LIVTVRNDREGLVELLEALAAQTEMPDEVVVVDGGSDDGTLEELSRWDTGLAPLRVVVAPGANIAMGRNVAVRAAEHDWIVCTDAGCRPVPAWFSALKHVREATDIAAGTFTVAGETPLEQAMACAHYPVLDELEDPSRWVHLSHRLFGRDFRASHAGGRSMAFRREAWERAGGFPEHVFAGEDLAFSAAAARLGFATALVSEATVSWRPRATWLETARMFATYTRGDIRTPGRRRHLLRLVAWVAGALLVVRGGRRGRLLTVCGVAAYLWLPLRRAGRRRLTPSAWLQVPALVAVKDLSQLFGAGLGLFDAARGVQQPRPRPEGPARR
jgi:glycosyltransferase involved in cell wall biosynthesis